MQGEELTDSMRRGLVHHRMHRRSVLKRSAAAGAGLLGASLFGNAILAQDDATPEATPVAGSDSGGAATYQVNPAARTPTPERSDYSTRVRRSEKLVRSRIRSGPDPLLRWTEFDLDRERW